LMALWFAAHSAAAQGVWNSTLMEAPRGTTDLEILADGSIYVAGGSWLRFVRDWGASKEWEYLSDCGRDVNHIEWIDSLLYCSDGDLGISVLDSTGVQSRMLTGIQITTNLLEGEEYFAGASRGQLFRSEDGGKTWAVDNVQRLLESDDRIVALARANDHICIAQGSPGWRSGDAFRVFSRSQDEWLASTIPALQHLEVFNDRFHSTVGRAIVVSDDCIHWSDLAVVPSDKDLEELFIEGDFILVGTIDHRYYHSTDGGRTWLNVDDRFNNIDPEFFTLGHDGYLYSISRSTGSIYKTFKPALQMFD